MIRIHSFLAPIVVKCSYNILKMVYSRTGNSPQAKMFIIEHVRLGTWATTPLTPSQYAFPFSSTSFCSLLKWARTTFLQDGSNSGRTLSFLIDRYRYFFVSKSMLLYSPDQECQKIFEAKFPIDSSQTKLKLIGEYRSILISTLSVISKWHACFLCLLRFWFVVVERRRSKPWQPRRFWNS